MSKAFDCDPVFGADRNEVLVVLLADLVNGADVRMIERGSRTSFAPETLQCLWVLRHVVRQEFQGDKAT